MGARPSQFKRGGGFLNGVDAVITGYQFSDEFNGKPFVPGKDPKTHKDKFHSLYVSLSARVDGAEEDVTTTLFAGGYDDFEVSDDGHTLTPVEDGRELGGGTAFAKLITSLVEAGFPETNLSETEINYEPIIGTRVRFVQRVNAEDTKKLGKQKDKKTGKEYERKDLLIETVYELAKANKPAAKSAKPAGKTAKGAAPVEDIKDLSGRALLEIVQAAGGSITKQKTSMKTLLTPLLKGNPQRDAVRQWLQNDDNLNELVADGAIAYDQESGEIQVAG